MPRFRQNATATCRDATPTEPGRHEVLLGRQSLRLNLDDGDDAAGWRDRPGLVERHGEAHNAVGDAILIVGHVSEKLGPQVRTGVLVELEFLVLKRDGDVPDDACF